MRKTYANWGFRLWLLCDPCKCIYKKELILPIDARTKCNLLFSSSWLKQFEWLTFSLAIEYASYLLFQVWVPSALPEIVGWLSKWIQISLREVNRYAGFLEVPQLNMHHLHWFSTWLSQIAMEKHSYQSGDWRIQVCTIEKAEDRKRKLIFLCSRFLLIMIYISVKLGFCFPGLLFSPLSQQGRAPTSWLCNKKGVR